ncbi:hypothetical protein K456DRAFT_1820137, partial [Colletotrichum gloeosporioides 23]
PFSLGQAVSQNASPLPDPPPSVSDALRARLISYYLGETGTWCNTTDSEMHFTVKGIHKIMKSIAFSSAAMALASRQLDNAKGGSSQLTLNLYQDTIQFLLRHDPKVADPSILATCTLLCVYEMMSSGVPEWRRHLRGCAGLLRMRNSNGNSEGIVKTCFWAFTRIDVWAAFIMEQSTLIPTDSWVQDESVASVAAKNDLDDYCNLAILIFAKIVNVTGPILQNAALSSSEVAPIVNDLWNELQAWLSYRPKDALPLMSAGPTRSNPFPTVVFATSSPICGHTFYHAGCILLLQTGLLQPSLDARDQDLDPVWHARELVGLSISNESHFGALGCSQDFFSPNWVNQLQPLYIAGRVFGSWKLRPGRKHDLNHSADKSRHRQPGLPRHDEQPAELDPDMDDFPAEKMAILRQLATIERSTGWKTSDRARDLRVLWKLEH